MDSTSPRQHRDRFAAALTELWEAAGQPKGESLAIRVREARRRPPPPTRLPATFSEWRRGKHVPRDPQLLRDVIELLNERTQKPYRPQEWRPYWEQLWRAAHNEPKEGESSPVVAQPDTPAPNQSPPQALPELNHSPTAASATLPEVSPTPETLGRKSTSGDEGHTSDPAVDNVEAFTTVKPDLASELKAEKAGSPEPGHSAKRLRALRHPARWVTAMTLVTCAVLITLWIVLRDDPVQFRAPSEGEKVASPFLARGTAELPADTALWLLTQPPDGAYYPVGVEPVRVDDSGAWFASVSLGRGEQDIGLQYDLHAVIAPASGSSLDDSVAEGAGTECSARFDTLSSDVTHAAQVHVTLGKRGP